MSEAFLRQYNEVVVSEEYDIVEGKYNFHRSNRKNAYTKNMNKQATDGDLLRSTSLDGGSMFMSHSMFQESFASKTVDIENGAS